MISIHAQKMLEVSQKQSANRWMRIVTCAIDLIYEYSSMMIVILMLSFSCRISLPQP